MATFEQSLLSLIITVTQKLIAGQNAVFSLREASMTKAHKPDEQDLSPVRLRFDFDFVFCGLESGDGVKWEGADVTCGEGV